MTLKLSQLIPLGATNHIIRLTTGTNPPGDNIGGSDISLNTLAIGPSSDVDQFEAQFRNGVPSSFPNPRFIVGVGAPLAGLMLGKPGSGTDLILFNETRVSVFDPVSVAFFVGKGAKVPELQIHAFFQQPSFVPTTRSRDFFSASEAAQVGPGETQLLRRPFYGRSRFSFCATTFGTAAPVTYTLRGYKFNNGAALGVDLLTGAIPAVGGTLNLNMEGAFFDAIEAVATTTILAAVTFYSIEIADAIG